MIEETVFGNEQEREGNIGGGTSGLLFEFDCGVKILFDIKLCVFVFVNVVLYDVF